MKITPIKTLLCSSILILASTSYANARPQPPKQPKFDFISIPIENPNTDAVNEFPLVDTGQVTNFNNYNAMPAPQKGNAFYGQDAQHQKNPPSYTNNQDGTITDNVTSLVWQQSFEVMSYQQAVEKLKNFNLANKTDWRLPNIKEAYSLMLFSGKDISAKDMSRLVKNGKPFIDVNYFDFEYGANGKRPIDVQMLTSTVYQGTTMGGNQTLFGVNLADGRIKGYPLMDPRARTSKMYTVRFVRGDSDYGKNHFKNNNNGTISDLATHLMWQQSDNQQAISWQSALTLAQNRNQENYLGHNDWRLPNAKELQSIVDYSRSPSATHSAAINPLFNVTSIIDEGGHKNYPFYWTSTTHQNQHGGGSAVYVCFGEALGFFKPPMSKGQAKLEDVHGAGAQRSDPKVGKASDFPQGFGPQGDVRRINHYVRLVRDIN
ncbi:Lcl C-terminal domain-containing protein [Shewanella surugensis]|uniref:DUF1566 domain-containing protein n=1 Tax=Shewanella surugensis TaxID=212020 RepID=A0ABT0LIZ9_9GAMM|nr:DUF1566 domain-containing protein [Shewanella surugensis]MCL1127679.1 DUF1566 domain-containing protein [Shewanella surugensis]